MNRGVLVVLALAASLILSPDGSTTDAGPQDLGYRRIERVKFFSPAWKVSCQADDCGQVSSGIFGIQAETPVEQSVDIVVTVTLDYRTSRMDRPSFQMTFVPVAGPPSPAPLAFMRPKQWPARPSSESLTASTFTWVKRNADAGTDYDFGLAVIPRDGDGDGSAEVNGRRIAVVVEMSSSAV